MDSERKGEHIPVSDSLTQKFLQILLQNKFTTPIMTIAITKPPGIRVDRFAGSAVTVTITLENGEEITWFLKMWQNVPSEKWARDRKLMEKEAHFYTQFLPKLRQFCDKYDGCQNLLNFFPHCYHGNEEMVVLDYLVLQGFSMPDPEIKHDFSTAKFVLEHLAKFHGTNYAFLQASGGAQAFRTDAKFLELTRLETLFTEGDPTIPGMCRSAIVTGINILKLNPVPGSEDAITKLESTLEQSNFLIQRALSSDKPMSLLNHGDLHGANMLFKRDREILTEMMFVDLQLTRFGSPNLDIGFYLYTSVSPKVRRRCFKDLLEFYHQSFESILKRFSKSCPISLEDLLEDYKTSSNVGYFFGLRYLTAIQSLRDFQVDTVQFRDAIQSWITQNPGKSKDLAEELVSLVNEREQ